MSSDKHILPAGVMLVHLASGEDFIARVEIDIEQKFYMLWGPMTPVMHSRHLETSEQTGMSASLIPYLLYLDTSEPLLIRDANVLFTGTVVKALETLYGQLSGTSVASQAAHSADERTSCFDGDNPTTTEPGNGDVTGRYFYMNFRRRNA